MITRKAYAKINLALDVTGRLPNGYHTVKMVMQTVDLWDELQLEKCERREKEAYPIYLSTDAGELSAGPDNLIFKAAALLYDRFDMAEGVSIHLQKNIPIAAGMAGGSTDAAGTLLGMNELFGLGLSEQDLCELGVKIGADVPYCIMGGTVLAEGIGEVLTRLPDAPELILGIAKPEVGVSTKYVYETLDGISDDLQHPDVDGMVEILGESDAAGVEETSAGIISRLGNVLEEVTIPAYPVVGQIKDIFRKAGAKGVLMSGSGPTVFAVFDTKEQAQHGIEEMKKSGLAKDMLVSRAMRP